MVILLSHTEAKYKSAVLYILNMEHISKTYGDKVIFNDISCGIQAGDSIPL